MAKCNGVCLEKKVQYFINQENLNICVNTLNTFLVVVANG